MDKNHYLIEPHFSLRAAVLQYYLYSTQQKKTCKTYVCNFTVNQLLMDKSEPLYSICHVDLHITID